MIVQDKYERAWCVFVCARKWLITLLICRWMYHVIQCAKNMLRKTECQLVIVFPQNRLHFEIRQRAMNAPFPALWVQRRNKNAEDNLISSISKTVFEKFSKAMALDVQKLPLDVQYSCETSEHTGRLWSLSFDFSHPQMRPKDGSVNHKMHLTPYLSAGLIITFNIH